MAGAIRCHVVAIILYQTCHGVLVPMNFQHVAALKRRSIVVPNGPRQTHCTLASYLDAVDSLTLNPGLVSKRILVYPASASIHGQHGAFVWTFGPVDRGSTVDSIAQQLTLAN
jgi:hypothetical protein